MKEKKRISWEYPVTLLLALGMLAAGLWLRMQSYAARNDMEDAVIYQEGSLLYEQLCFLGILAAVSLICFLVIRRTSLEKIIRRSLPFYAVVVIFCIVAGMGNRYNSMPSWVRMGSFMVFVPCLLYFALFGEAYLVSRYRTFGFWYVYLIAAVSVVVPCAVALLEYHAMAVCMTIFLTFLGLCIKTTADKRMDSFWVKSFLVFLVIGLVMTIYLYYSNEYLSQRMTAVLSRGASDPEGTGWIYVQIQRALQGARFLGPSDVMLEDGISMASFFAHWDYAVCAPLIILLRFGFAGMAVFELVPLITSILLLRLAKRAKTSYAMYLGTGVGVLFLVRILLNIPACFLFSLSHATLPFCGNMTVQMTDAVLLVSSLCLCAKEGELSPGLLDREAGTSELLARLKETESERLKSLLRLITLTDDEFLDDDLWDDDELDEYLEEYLEEDAAESTGEEDGKNAGEDAAKHKRSGEQLGRQYHPDPEKVRLISEVKQLRSRIREIEEDSRNLQEKKVSSGDINRKYASSFAEGEKLPPYRGSEPYLFLSYAHRNIDEALEIVRHLQENGYRVWYDEGIDPGTEWDENIAEHIEKCAVFVALISKEYLESQNCKDELYFARETVDERLLVYLTDTELPSGMKMRTGRLQAIHKYRYRREEEFYEKLYAASGIHRCRER